MIPIWPNFSSLGQSLVKILKVCQKKSVIILTFSTYRGAWKTISGNDLDVASQKDFVQQSNIWFICDTTFLDE